MQDDVLRKPIAGECGKCGKPVRLMQRTDTCCCDVATERPFIANAISPATCEHNIADARNKVIKSGYICTRCGTLFRGMHNDSATAIALEWEGKANAAIASRDAAYAALDAVIEYAQTGRTLDANELLSVLMQHGVHERRLMPAPTPQSSGEAAQADEAVTKDAARRAIGYVMAMDGPMSLVRTLQYMAKGEQTAQTPTRDYRSVCGASKQRRRDDKLLGTICGCTRV